MTGVQWHLLWDHLQRLGVNGPMFGAIQPLYAECLLSTRVDGMSGDSQFPSRGRRQGCPLTATLFSLFIDALHHHLETMAPQAGIQVQSIGCEVWGMHGPRVAAAKRERSKLPRLHDLLPREDLWSVTFNRILLVDNLSDAFYNRARNMTSCLTPCLWSVG